MNSEVPAIQKYTSAYELKESNVTAQTIKDNNPGYPLIVLCITGPQWQRAELWAGTAECTSALDAVIEVALVKKELMKMNSLHFPWQFCLEWL